MTSATTNLQSVRPVVRWFTLLVVLAAISWIVFHHSHGGIKGIEIPVGNVASCVVSSVVGALICKRRWLGIAVPFIAGICGALGIVGQFYSPYGGVLGLLVGCGVLVVPFGNRPRSTGPHPTQSTSSGS